eukprot:15203-Heterococcus_DN1.PRE.2
MRAAGAGISRYGLLAMASCKDSHEKFKRAHAHIGRESWASVAVVGDAVQAYCFRCIKQLIWRQLVELMVLHRAAEESHDKCCTASFSY